MKGTCIVGIVHGASVWIGCDSMASGEYVKAPLVAPKVFRVGDMLIGVCGTVRGRDVIEFAGTPDRPESMTGDREYLIRTYVPHLRQAMKESGMLSIDDGIEEYYGAMLIGYRERLYVLDSDFSIMEHERWAVGSGSEYALGSLFSTTGDPQKRIRQALNAAVEFSPTCGPPFHIEKL